MNPNEKRVEMAEEIKPSEEKPVPSMESEEKVAEETGKSRSTRSVSLEQVLDLYTGVSEKTFNDSPYWPESQKKPYNPDDLVQKSRDYRIYEEMMNDDQVSVCLQIKRDLVIGAGWDIVPEVEDPAAQMQCKDLQARLSEDPEVSFDDMIEEMLSSYGYGFSIGEKIFKYREDDSLTLSNIKFRHPSTWELPTDAHGNIEEYIQHGPQGDISVKPKSLIHYVTNRRFGNPYGRSDLRSAYNAYFIKRQVVKWYAIFLEKAASPTPIARYAAGTTQGAINDIHQALKSLQTKTSMTIPKGLEVEFLESKTHGEAYEKAINIFNMFIGRSMMIPDLLGFQGSETGGGSLALGKEQLKSLFMHIMRRRTGVERIVNKHIIQPLVVTNFGFVENHPKFKLRPIDEEKLLEFAKLWVEAIKGKFYKPSDEEINVFRSIVKFPQGEVEREKPAVMFDPQGNAIQPDGSPVPPPEGGKPGMNKPVEEDSEELDEEVEDGEDMPTPAQKEKSKEEKGGKQFKALLYSALDGQYDHKVDYSSVLRSMEDSASVTRSEVMPVVKRLFDDVYEQIRSKKILESQDPEKLASFKLKSPKELNLIIKRNLREGFKTGMLSGQRELLRGVFKIAPLPADKFLDLIDAETYAYIGDWVYKVEQSARVRILEAIRDGKPLSAVIDMMDEDDMQSALASIERYSRTKFTEVMNKGRLESFKDSGVVAAYQYSAILDDRVSEICAGLHGKIFKDGDEPVPPMHFNCRSLLVPITKYESFEADDEVGGQDIEDFISENKGDGFARS